MLEAMDNELTRGHKEYDSKVKNLEGIFSKIREVLDISKYLEEFRKIQEEVSSNPDFSKEMASSNMQIDYESFTFKEYNKRLEELTKEIEEECLPFYELYLLSSKIDTQILKISAENIGEIIVSTKTLIDAINTLNTHNEQDKEKLIQQAYQTVYSAILYEEVFDRSEILSYIQNLNVGVNKENIGRLLEVDLKKLDREDIIEEDLRAIKSEGLGYDYLTVDIIREVSRKTVGCQDSEYQERKNQAISELSSKMTSFSKEKDELVSCLNDNKSQIKKLHINRGILTAKVLSMVLVPLVTFSAGRIIGTKISNNITEYKTITRTINAQTKEVVGDTKEIYDENETTYAATILYCDPWRKNPTGAGYVRTVTAYEYITPEDVGEDYHVTVDDLDDHVSKKYSYVEPKPSLESEDSTENCEILITETYQDKNQNRPSTKFILPFSIIGIGLGIVIDVLIIVLKKYSYEEVREMFDNLSDEIKEHKLSSQEIKERLVQMKKAASLLQDEYNDIVKKYGDFQDRLILPEIDTTWLLGNTKKR